MSAPIPTTQEPSSSLTNAFLQHSRPLAKVVFVSAFAGVIGINSFLGALKPEYSDRAKAVCLMEKPATDRSPPIYCINWFASTPGAFIRRTFD
jgi:hypothetical protein